MHGTIQKRIKKNSIAYKLKLNNVTEIRLYPKIFFLNVWNSTSSQDIKNAWHIASPKW